MVPQPSADDRRPPLELARFCEQQWPRLVGTLGFLVRDIRTAEDLAQEALARVCQHWHKVSVMDFPSHRLSLDRAPAVRSWLHRDSPSRWLDRLGARRRVQSARRLLPLRHSRRAGERRLVRRPLGDHRLLSEAAHPLPRLATLAGIVLFQSMGCIFKFGWISKRSIRLRRKILAMTAMAAAGVLATAEGAYAHHCINPNKPSGAGVHYTIEFVDENSPPILTQIGNAKGIGGFVTIAGSDVFTIGNSSSKDVVGGPGSQKPEHACDGTGIDYLGC